MFKSCSILPRICLFFRVSYISNTDALLFLISCMGVLADCMSIHPLCASCPWMPETMGNSGPGLQVIVRGCVVGGNSTLDF